MQTTSVDDASRDTENRSGLSVAKIIDELRRRQLRLPFEIGAFLVLEVNEHVLPSPRRVIPTEVFLERDGAIRVGDLETADDETAARSVSALLAHVLVASGAGVPTALLRLVESGPSSGDWDLEQLRGELEASLIPLNRAASRRVLARVLREVQAPARKSGQPGGVLQPCDPEVVDEELDSFLRRHADSVIPAAEPTTTTTPRPVASRRTDPRETAKVPGRKSTAPRTSPATKRADDHELAKQAHQDLPDLERLDSRDGNGRGRVFWVVAIAAAAGFSLYYLKPDWFRSESRQETAPTAEEPAVRSIDPANAEPSTEEVQTESAETSPEPVPETAAPALGTVTLHVQPAAALVAVFLGRSPAVATDLPVGIEQEFIATKPGHAPARAVLPADARWNESNGEWLYELAMQLRPQPESAQSVEDFGSSSLEALGSGRATDRRGTVRVLTHPPDAKVYRAVGFGATVELRGLSIDRGHELLITAPGHAAQRIVVGPSDWVERDDQRGAEINVTLQPSN